MMSPIQTEQPYAPGDGVTVNLGAVVLHDLVVVAPAKGGPGTLSGGMRNTSNQAVPVTFAADGGGTVTFDAPANTEAPLSSDQSRTTLPSVTAPAGALQQMTVSAPNVGGVSIGVPVLDAQSYYQSLLPTAGATTTP